EPLTQTIQRRQLRYIGHCLRRNTNEFINMYALYTPKSGHGTRKRGRPRLNYPDYVARLINNDTPPTIEEIRKTAVNREEWQSNEFIIISNVTAAFHLKIAQAKVFPTWLHFTPV
ncbi:unnamed protein product, partial [Rotaria socialis]